MIAVLVLIELVTIGVGPAAVVRLLEWRERRDRSHH